MSALPPKSGLSITACVLGALGFLTCGLTAVPAIICGHLGRSRVRRSAGTVGGAGLALAGLIMGYVTLVMGLGGGFVAYRQVVWTQNGLRRHHTYETQQAIATGLEAYKERFGEYPSPARPGVRLEMDGLDFDVGGALMLYQVITGDGADMIRTAEGAPAASAGNDSAAAEGSNTSFGIQAEAIRNTSAGYVLVDAWGHPFQYSFGEADTVNPTFGSAPYDLWSFGKARSQLRTDKTSKRDIKIVDDWIINWQ